MARVVGCAFLVAVGVGAFVDRAVPARGRGPAPLGASAVAPLPRVVVDLDVVADTLPLESEVYLETLQHLRPEGPWAELRELPDHRWRTFDLSAKFARVLAERRVARPAEATMILRLLFEEDEVGKRALAARDDPSGQRWDGGGWAPTEGDLAGVRPGTRPLTAGEVVENWDEVLRWRCLAAWQAEDRAFSEDAIDAACAATIRSRLRTDAAGVADALSWRPDALRALRAACDAGTVDEALVLVRADLLGFANAPDDRETLEGWRRVVGGVLPGADCALATGALDVADEIDLYDGQTLYYGGSPQLTLQLGAALKQEVDARTAGLHLCRWVKRWTPGGAPPPTLTSFNIIQLENDHRDFRLALGLTPSPGGKGARD